MVIKEKDNLRHTQKSTKLWLGTVLVSIVLSACGVNSSSAPASGSQDSEGNFKIELTTNPSPLTTGDATFIVTLKDKQDKLVEGADVNVSYSMTTMNMGVTSGTATDEGKGIYTIKGNIGHGGGLKISVAAEKKDLGKGLKDYQLEIK